MKGHFWKVLKVWRPRTIYILYIIVFFLICHKTPIWITCAWNCYLSMASRYYLFACVQYVHMRARVVTRVNPRRTCRRQSWRSWLTWFTECRQWEVGVRGSEITRASGGKWFTISSGWIFILLKFQNVIVIGDKELAGVDFESSKWSPAIGSEKY